MESRETTVECACTTPMAHFIMAAYRYLGGFLPLRRCSVCSLKHSEGVHNRRCSMRSHGKKKKVYGQLRPLNGPKSNEGGAHEWGGPLPHVR